MLKNYFAILLLLLGSLLPFYAFAESHCWQLGIQAGTDIPIKAHSAFTFSPRISINARYVNHLSIGDNGKFGFSTGLDFGYGQCTISGNFTGSASSVWSGTDENNHITNYKVTNSYNFSGSENHRYIQASIPFLLSAKGSWFTFGCGPKINLIVYDQYTCHLTKANISTTFDDLGTSVTNDPYTGQIHQLNSTGTYGLPIAGFAGCVEIGGEIPLKKYKYSDVNFKHIGIQLFAEWTFYNLVKGSPVTVSPSEISADPVALVNYNGFANTSATSRPPFHVGLKIYYSFDNLDFKHKGLLEF